MDTGKSADLTGKYLAQLHKGARASTHQHARELRQRTTEAEEKLWALLRNRQLKRKKFRRQHAIAGYVADFYCHESKLIVEMDGNFHMKPEAKKYDNARTALLNEMGIVVLRFWNEELINDPEKVLQKISDHLH
jgi:very-short-patch-repair endonuclease